MSGSLPSYTENAATDFLLSQDSMQLMSRLAVGNQTELTTTPYVSALFGSFAKLPPMYVLAGTAELLKDDAVQVVEKAKKAGGEAHLLLRPHMQHDYVIFGNGDVLLCYGSILQSTGLHVFI